MDDSRVAAAEPHGKGSGRDFLVDASVGGRHRLLLCTSDEFSRLEGRGEVVRFVHRDHWPELMANAKAKVMAHSRVIAGSGPRRQASTSRARPRSVVRRKDGSSRGDPDEPDLEPPTGGPVLVLAGGVR